MIARILATGLAWLGLIFLSSVMTCAMSGALAPLPLTVAGVFFALLYSPLLLCAGDAS